MQYAKTEILQPGEAQTLKITFRYEDMASYDSNGIKSANGAYVLEAGDYKINLCSDSHTILDTMLPRWTRTSSMTMHMMALAPQISGCYKPAHLCAGRCDLSQPC